MIRLYYVPLHEIPIPFTLIFVVSKFLPRNRLMVRTKPPGDASDFAYFFWILAWTPWWRWISTKRGDTVCVYFGMLFGAGVIATSQCDFVNNTVW